MQSLFRSGLKLKLDSQMGSQMAGKEDFFPTRKNSRVGKMGLTSHFFPIDGGKEVWTEKPIKSLIIYIFLYFFPSFPPYDAHSLFEPFLSRFCVCARHPQKVGKKFYRWGEAMTGGGENLGIESQTTARSHVRSDLVQKVLTSMPPNLQNGTVERFCEQSVLNLRELCSMLQVSRTTLWTMRKEPGFPAPRFGKKFLRSDIETWLQKRNVQFCSIDSEGLPPDIHQTTTVDRIQA